MTENTLTPQNRALEALLSGDVPSTRRDGVVIELADSEKRYEHWPSPTVIISDGAYGVSGFPGDPASVDGLAQWYAPHIASWSRHALPATTLWFWNTEVGWATVHPLLLAHGWEYRTLHIWNKGIAHIAGNVNGKTIRRFPVATEVCAQYVRKVKLKTPEGIALPLQEWLRHEWLRTGLPLNKTNEACRVQNAATRKYFTHDNLWYFPPPEMMERVSGYANLHGLPSEWPYFSVDGFKPVTAPQWAALRAKWNHLHGVTNVWSEPAVRGVERLRGENSKYLHTNQKPLSLLERIVLASSDENDVVWEPFGGLCSGAIACLRNGRSCCSAELLPVFYSEAKKRLQRESSLNESRRG